MAKIRCTKCNKVFEGFQKHECGARGFFGSLADGISDAGDAFSDMIAAIGSADSHSHTEGGHSGHSDGGHSSCSSHGGGDSSCGSSCGGASCGGGD